MTIDSVPHGWQMRTLAELGVWRGGGTPSKASAAYWSDGTIPWVSPKDMKSFRIRSTQDRITEAAVRNSSTNLLPAHSVAVVTRSGILERTLPVAVIEVDAAVNQDLKVLTPADGVDPAFVAYYLRAFERDILTQCSKNGTTVASIDFPKLLRFPIPIPPLHEQKQIVAAIETQFARLDDAVAALRRARTRLRRYRASVLESAVHGRLFDSAGADGWQLTPLGHHIERIDAGKNFRCKERPPSLDEVGVVKISAVTWGEYDELESKTCNDSSMLRPDLLIRPGDFLISRANTIDLVGACVIAKHVTLPVMLSDKVLRIRFRESVDPRWVLYFLRSKTGRAEIENRASGSQDSMRNIGQQRIKDIPIPVPPLVEQERIVAEVERLMSVIEQIEATIETSLRRAEALRQAILRRAFSGRLVRPGARDGADIESARTRHVVGAISMIAPTRPLSRGSSP